MADEQHTGGMIALVPRKEDADAFAVRGGDPVDEMHLTLAYLGDDVTDLTASLRNIIASGVAEVASRFGPIEARVFGIATFNPDGFDGREPCAVYIVGGTRDITEARELLVRYAGDIAQHEPFIPHVTAGYGIAVTKLSATGPIIFDRLRLALADQVYDFPLGEEKGAQVDLESKRQFSQQERGKAAKSGNALDDGSFPINNADDLDNAINAYGRAKPEKRAKLRAHIRKHAARLGKTDKLDKLAKKSAYDGLSDFEIKMVIQYKVMSPSPNAAKLREYWAHGEGVKKWRPGTPGDFNRLRRHLAKYVQNPKILDGLTANIHKLATGEWPGPKAHGGKKSVTISAEEFKAALLLADPDAELGDDALMPLMDGDGSTDSEDGEDDDLGPDDDFERALIDDIDWEIDGDGLLVPEDAEPEDDEADNFDEAEPDDGQRRAVQPVTLWD